jgi:hypothetical protein
LSAREPRAHPARMMHTRFSALLLGAAIAGLASAACGSVDPSSPTAPANPANTNLTGVWTGTLSRPGSLGSVQLRWTVTQSSQNLTGPLTLTYNGVTLDAVMHGSWSGGEKGAQQTVGSLRIERPNATVLPGCGVFLHDGGPSFSVTPTSTTLTSNTFPVNYANCRGFIATDTGGPVTESTQMTLNK